MAIHSSPALRSRMSSAPPRPFCIDDTLPSARPSSLARGRRGRVAATTWVDDPATTRWVVAGIWAVTLGLMIILASLVSLGGKAG